MFKLNESNVSHQAVAAISEHLYFLLKMKNEEITLHLELRPIQLALLQGIIQLYRAYPGFPEEYDSELWMISRDIENLFHKSGYTLPSVDIPQYCFSPLIFLLSSLQLVEIDADPEESEEGDDD